MKRICVFCGSRSGRGDTFLALARSVGTELAQRGIGIVYGGGRVGLMGALADAALEAGGEVIGVIIPSMNTDALAHIRLTRMDITPDMHARKARMHELADGYIALPGGFGTFDELFEAITWGQVGAHQKPIGLLNIKNYYAPLLTAIDHAVDEGFIFHEHRDGLCCKTDPEKLLNAMANHKHPHEASRRGMRQE